MAVFVFVSVYGPVRDLRCVVCVAKTIFPRGLAKYSIENMMARVLVLTHSNQLGWGGVRYVFDKPEVVIMCETNDWS